MREGPGSMGTAAVRVGERVWLGPRPRGERGRRVGHPVGASWLTDGRRRWGLLCLIVLVAAGSWSGAVAAPSGASTPVAATPVAQGDCVVPAGGSSESKPTPGVTPTKSAGDVIIQFVDETPDAATPATIAGTPVATTAGAADATLAPELTAVAHALAACFSQGKASTIVNLATERYLGQLYGDGTPLSRDDYLKLAPDLDPVPTVIRSLRDVRLEKNGHASAEVVSVVGKQLLRGRWTFVQAPRAERKPGRTAWRVDAEAPLAFTPPADVTRLEVAMEEYAFGLTETEAKGPDVVLSGRNGGAEDHEMLILRFASGLTTADLLRQTGPGLPRGVTYVGQATVPAGGRASLVLVGLKPGDYTIVCLFPTQRGTPHLALGMEATFTVT